MSFLQAMIVASVPETSESKEKTKALCILANTESDGQRTSLLECSVSLDDGDVVWVAVVTRWAGFRSTKMWPPWGARRQSAQLLATLMWGGDGHQHLRGECKGATRF